MIAVRFIGWKYSNPFNYLKIDKNFSFSSTIFKILLIIMYYHADYIT